MLKEIKFLLLFSSFSLLMRYTEKKIRGLKNYFNKNSCLKTTVYIYIYIKNLCTYFCRELL